jgi:hypothetical protein
MPRTKRARDCSPTQANTIDLGNKPARWRRGPRPQYGTGRRLHLFAVALDGARVSPLVTGDVRVHGGTCA